jgi:glyoxylase-like metal-dependent hydrolase (beta-lactamase superfamily II)
VTLLATPGHTPTSVSLYDPQRHQLFSGDFIYPGHLYAFLPGASRSAYLATTRELLATIAADARIYAAHMAEPPAPAAAPVLMISDLRALETTLVAIEQGQAVATGFYPRMFPVNETMIFATGWAWNNR